MTETEKQELNEWLAKHVAQWNPVHYSHRCDGETIIRCGACGALGHSNCYGNGLGAITFTCKSSPCCSGSEMPDYTGNDFNIILDLCAEKLGGREIAIKKTLAGYSVGVCDWFYESVDCECEAETIQIAVGMFAKKITPI